MAAARLSALLSVLANVVGLALSPQKGILKHRQRPRVCSRRQVVVVLVTWSPSPCTSSLHMRSTYLAPAARCRA